jgi:methyl-accepting chemotaxis protein
MTSPPPADRFGSERQQILLARHQQALSHRWALVLLYAVIGVVATRSPAMIADARTIVAAVVLAAVVNGVASALARRARPWHFWTLIATEIVTAGLMLAGLGHHGYIIAPALVFAVGGYALGLPRAAQITGGVWLFAYLPLRALGYARAGLEIPWDVLVLEWLFTMIFSYAATLGPIAVTRRVRKARQALAAVEGGDFTARLPSRYLDDLGFLATSFNAMTESVGAAATRIQTRAIELVAMAEQLSSASHQLNGSAESIGASTGELAREAGAQQQEVAAAEDAAAEVLTISRSLREESIRSASEARTMAAAARGHAAGIGATGTRLMEISEEFGRTSTAMERLNAAGAEIEEFVLMVREITEQTNLLALNAAIEAARAGEHGRGFGIVAEQVRKLAFQTAGSAEHIQEVVARTRAAIEEARSRVGAGAARLGETRRAAASAEESLGEIVAGLGTTAATLESFRDRAGAQDDHTAALAGAVRGAGRRAESFVERSLNTAATTEQQVASIQQLSAMSQTLAHTADELLSASARFRAEAPTEAG